MRQLFFLLLFINSTSIATFSQFEYKIKICDGITNKPIPYATLMWGSINGIATDSSGTVLFKTLKKIDTFFVSSVGYIPSILLLDTVTLNNYTIVKLNRSFKQLEDVIIFTNPTTKAYSVTKEKPNSNLTSSIGNLLQTAILIKPSNAVEKLSSISFYAYDGSNKNAKIRLRLYKKNNDNTSIDIVNNNIIINNILQTLGIQLT
jgi:hypothetical protein